MWRAPSPNRCGSFSASTAARTRSRLSSGSPMPMNTTFVRRWPSAGEPARGVADLVDDLGGLEVAPEPELAGRAERAADRAAGLARDAQGVALALARAGRVVHQHRLDRAPRRTGDGGAFSVRPAVGRPELGVADRVEPERAVDRVPQSARGASAHPRPTSPAGRQTASPTWRARYAGSPRVASQAVSSSGARPDRPGRGSRAAAGRRSGGGPRRRRLGRRSRERIVHAGRHGTAHAERPPTAPCRADDHGRPRRNASPVIRRPPAGWTSSQDEAARRPSPGPGRLLRHDPARLVVASARPGDRRPPDDRAGRRRLDEAARPRQIGADLALEQRRRHGRVEPPVGAPQRPRQSSTPRLALGLRLHLARQPRVERSPQQPGRGDRAGAPRAPARSRRHRAASARWPDERARVDAGVHPHQASPRSRASPARIAAGIGVAPR